MKTETAQPTVTLELSQIEYNAILDALFLRLAHTQTMIAKVQSTAPVPKWPGPRRKEP